MIGSAIASVAGGVMSYDSAKSAQKSSDRQTSLAQANREAAVSAIEGNQANVDALQEFMTSMGTQGVEYAQDLLDSWEGTFGGLQENLSSYYNSLDPTKFAMQEKTQFKQALDKQMSQYNETLSSSGLQSSGMRAQTMKEAAFKTAEANAQIDINAPEQVAQMQQGFLNYGDTQRAGAQNAYNAALANQAQYGLIGYNAQTNQASNIANAYNANAATQEQAAANYGASSAGYMQSAGNMLGAGANQFGSVPGMKTMMSGIDSGIMGSIGGATGAPG